MQVITENKVVPKLRFGEFEDKYILKSLSEIGVFKNGLNKDKKDFGFGYPFINLMDVFGKNSITDSEFDLVNANARELNDYKIVKGDTLFIRSSVKRTGVGETSVLLKDYNNLVFSGFLIRFRDCKDEINLCYKKYCFSTKSIRKQILRLATSSANTNINQESLSKIKIYLPSASEQQKIASFLGAVDEKSQQLTKKKELLKEYKKGVMQKIFSQELRFKDDNGNNYPDWEEKKLGDIGEFKTSSVDKLIKEDEQMVSLVNYMNVYNHQNITNEITKDLMQVSAKEKQIETSNLKRGDILFTPSSETPSDIGHSIVIFEDLYNTLYSYHLMRFRPIINLDILYSHYFCNIPSVLRQITRFATGSTRFTISVGSFSKLMIQLPSLDEQKKIANFLSSLDSKIELISTQIENTKAFKKGLLQQMFV